MIDNLLKYILWYEFLNDLNAHKDFDKKCVTKKPVKENHSYLKYALIAHDHARLCDFLRDNSVLSKITQPFMIIAH